MKHIFQTKLLLLLCMLTCAGVGWAETLTVANGTATSSYAPIYGNWADAYLKCEYVVSADKLSEMENGSIEGLTWYLSSPASAAWTGTFQVFIKEVPDATISAFSGTDGATVVYEGTIDGTGSTIELNFTDTYDYSGGNLLIGVYQTVKGNYKAATFSGEAVTSASVYGYNSSSLGSVSPTSVSFVPKTTFTYTAGEKPDYAASVSGESLAFGTIPTGGTATLNVTVRNKGANAITPAVSGLEAPFSTTYTAAELASGEMATIPVAFNPTAAGSFNGTMTINCGEAGSFDVALTGAAANMLTLYDGVTNTTSYLPVYTYWSDAQGTTCQMIYPASDLTSLVGKAITEITFYSSGTTLGCANAVYSVTMGVDADHTEFASNSADALYTNLDEVYSGTLSINADRQVIITLDAPFTYTGGNLVISTEVTTKGTSASYTYFYAKYDSSTAPGIYKYNSNVSRVNYLPKVTFAFDELQDDMASVRPAALDFGTQLVGQSAELTFTVKNLGINAFTPTVSGAEAPFEVLTTAAEISAGAEQAFTVKYAPTEGGVHNGTITVDCGNAGNYEVTLTGKALAVPTGYQEDFNAIAEGDKMPQGWKSVIVPVNRITVPNSYGPDNLADLEEGDTYLTIIEDGDNKAIAFDRTSFQNNYVYSAYYLISPEVKGNVFITGKHTSTSSPYLKVYPIVNQDGVDVVDNKNPITVTWEPALNMNGWSYGTFNMAESGRVAIGMVWSAIDFFAADEMIASADIALTELKDVPAEVTANEAGVATIDLTAVVKNSGLVDIADGAYTVAVYDYAAQAAAGEDDEVEALTSVTGTALTVGESKDFELSFEYAPENIQPTQNAKFVVVVTMGDIMKSLTTDNINIRALVAVGKLYAENGTSAYTKTDLSVFNEDRTLTVQMGNNGTAPLTFTVTPVEGVTVEPASGTVNADSKQPIALTFSGVGTYDGAVATIATNAGDFTVEAAAARIADGTFLEDFEDDVMADGWIYTAGTTGMQIKNLTYVVSGADMTYNQKLAFFSGFTTTVNTELITPAIEFNTETGLDLHFTTAGYSVAPTFKAYYSTDRANWTEFEGEVAMTRMAFTNTQVTLPEAGTYFVKFDIWGAAIDNIYGGQLATLEHDAMFTEFSGSNQGMVNMTNTYTAKLKNMLADADSYTVDFVEDGENVLATVEVADLASKAEQEMSFDYTPRVAGTHTVQAIAKAGDYEVNSAVITVNVAEESAVIGMIVNNGTSTTLDASGNYAIINSNYDATATRLIYTKAQIEEAGVKEGDKITKVAFLVKKSDRTNALNFNLWARSTEDATLAAGAICSDIEGEGFTQVFSKDNVLDMIPAAGGEFELTLSEPIIYDGKNLEFLTFSYGAYQSKYIQFYYNSVENQMLFLKRDGQSDAATMFGSPSASLSTQLPSLKLYVEQEPVEVAGVVTNALTDEPIEGATVTLTKGNVIYTATTDADGAYTATVIQAGEGYNIVAAAEGFIAIEAETIDVTENMTKNFALMPESTPGTLEQLLAGEDVDLINEDLHICEAFADDNMVYVADEEGNWIGLKVSDDVLSEIVESNDKVLKANTVRGTGRDLDTNPAIDVVGTPELIAGEAAEPVAINMAASFNEVKGNTIVRISAYYKGDYFSAFYSDYEGQMLSINNAYMETSNLVMRQRYDIKGVLRLKAAWDPETEANGAPRKVKVTDSNYHDNMEIMPYNVNIVTGVDDLNVNGNAVGVKYYNVAGMASDKPFEGVNIVVTRNADGTTSTTKVVF